MTARLPKFTKSRPFGMPDTPFNPMTGKHLSLSNDPDILKAVVTRKIADSDNVYICHILNVRAEKTGETLKVHRLVYDLEDPDEVLENTVVFIYKVDNKWWFQAGGESEYPTIHYMVENFDRVDDDSIGSLWENDSQWSIRNGRGYESGAETVSNSATSGHAKRMVYLSISAYTTYVHSSLFYTFTSVDPLVDSPRAHDDSALIVKALTETVDVIYKAIFSQADQNIKIDINCSKFFVEDHQGFPNNGGYSAFIEFATHIPPEYQSRGTRVLVAAGLSEGGSIPAESCSCAGYYTCAGGGVFDTYESLPASAFPQEQAVTATITNNDGSSSYYISNVVEEINENFYATPDPPEQCGNSIHKAYIENYVRKFREKWGSGHTDVGLVAGVNTFYFEVRSGTISAWINGQSLYSGQSMYTVGNGMFGLRGFYSVLTQFLDDEGDNHVRQIKVWNADIPEPPDSESGHGQYMNGNFVYSDKYHAGETYNPDA